MKKGLKVGKYNALSADTASARTGPAYDGEYYTATLRLAMWHEKPKNFRAHIYIQKHTHHAHHHAASAGVSTVV